MLFLSKKQVEKIKYIKGAADLYNDLYHHAIGKGIEIEKEYYVSL